MALDDEKPRVLVIDDEQPQLDTFRRVFRHDFEMMFAPSVGGGLDLVRRYAFDVAIVDFAMPDEDGLVFLREAAILKPQLTRLMVTAHADLAEVKRAYDEGLSHAIIMKPWNRDSIMRWVTTALRMKSLKKSVSEMRLSVEKK